MRLFDVFFSVWMYAMYVRHFLIGSSYSAPCAAIATLLLTGLLTSKAHIFRSNGAMGLKVCMYSNPPMGGRQPKFQKKISAQKKVFVLLPPHTLKAHISGSNGPPGAENVPGTLNPMWGTSHPKLGIF